MRFLLFSILISSSALAAEGYIKSLKAPLLEKPQNGATTLAVLERGAPVDQGKTEGAFVQVKANGLGGFVNKLFLSDRPVEGKNSLLNKDIDISSKARKRASGFTSSAAARGLKEDSDDVFAALGEAADSAQVLELEKTKIDEKYAFDFLLNPDLRLSKRAGAQ